jgi:hypothetical protein
MRASIGISDETNVSRAGLQWMTYKNIFTSAAAIILTACATSPENGSFKGVDTRNVESAVMSPVNDIGFDDIEIPAYLALMTDPYSAPPTSCKSLATEVMRLDLLLGADLDVPDAVAQRRQQRALNATSSTLGSVIIPFRGVVRALSGAAANERDAREAYERGLVRRAYLKGVAKQMNCPLIK